MWRRRDRVEVRGTYTGRPKTSFFGDDIFNSTFFAEWSGWWATWSDVDGGPTKTLEIQRPTTFHALTNFITSRTWSNLQIMTQEDINVLTSRIPSELSNITIAIDVYIRNMGRV